MPADIGAEAREAADRLLNGHGSESASRQPVGKLASTVKPERVSWLWPGRLAAGKITMLDGDPGLGKSTLTAEIAARISRGQPLPGGEAGSPRGVVLLSAEDGAADTIVPRLIAAGADLARVYILTGVLGPDGLEAGLSVPGALDAIEAAIVEHDAALVVIDPLVAYLGSDTSANKDQDVRRAMAPLAAMLERTGAASLCVRHLNKAAGVSALYRGGGSIGIIGAARIGLLVAKDPDDDEARVLVGVKNNLSKEADALRFRLSGDDGTDAARVIWDHTPVTLDASTLLAAAHGDDEDRSALQDAIDFLRDYLSLGPRAVSDVFKEARPEHRDVTLKRAKRRLGVQSQREGFGPGSRVLWYLPDYPPHGQEENAETAPTIQDQGVDPVWENQPYRINPSADDPLWENPRNHAENGSFIGAKPPIQDHSQDIDPVWGFDPPNRPSEPSPTRNGHAPGPDWSTFPHGLHGDSAEAEHPEEVTV